MVKRKKDHLEECIALCDEIMKEMTVPKKFLYSTSRNLLGLLQGKTIRIEGEDRKVRDLFYKTMVEVNDEFNYKCKFDYDEYHVAFAIKILKLKKNKNIVLTYFYGRKYPNVKFKKIEYPWFISLPDSVWGPIFRPFQVR